MPLMPTRSAIWGGWLARRLTISLTTADTSITSIALDDRDPDDPAGTRWPGSPAWISVISDTRRRVAVQHFPDTLFSTAESRCSLRSLVLLPLLPILRKPAISPDR